MPLEQEIREAFQPAKLEVWHVCIVKPLWLVLKTFCGGNLLSAPDSKCHASQWRAMSYTESQDVTPF